MATHSKYYELRERPPKPILFMMFLWDLNVLQLLACLKKKSFDNNDEWYLLSACYALGGVLSDQHVLNHLILQQLQEVGVIIVIIYR